MEQSRTSEGTRRRTGADRYNAIGIRVTAQQLVGVLVDLDGELVDLGSGRGASAGLRRHILSRPLKDTDVPTVVTDIAALVDELWRIRSGVGERVVGIGVTVGGHVDGRSGTVLHSPNLHWNDVVPLAHLLRQAVGIEVVEVENDVNALAVAEEAFGAGLHSEHFAVITVDLDGVGAGLILNHELYRGVGGLAGELGHIPDRGDELCRCQNHGCLETQAGGDVIVKRVREAGRPGVSNLDEAAALARQGDQIAWNAFERAGEALGRGLASIVNVLNLGLLIIHTEPAVLEVNGPYRIAALRTLQARAFSTAAASCKILWRRRTDELEGRGAASMAFHQLSLHRGLERGATGAAGELGHIPYERDGRHCVCGKRGCLQTVASSDAILRFISGWGGQVPPTIDAAIQEAKGGNELAARSFERAGEALGIGLATLLNIVNLEAVILCGDASLLAYDSYVGAARRSLAAHAFSTTAEDCDLLIEVRTDELEAQGAASMALDTGGFRP